MELTELKVTAHETYCYKNETNYCKNDINYVFVIKYGYQCDGRILFYSNGKEKCVMSSLVRKLIKEGLGVIGDKIGGQLCPIILYQPKVRKRGKDMRYKGEGGEGISK